MLEYKAKKFLFFVSSVWLTPSCTSFCWTRRVSDRIKLSSLPVCFPVFQWEGRLGGERVGEINRCIFPEPVNNLFLMAGYSLAGAAVEVEGKSSSAELTCYIFHVGEKSTFSAYYCKCWMKRTWLASQFYPKVTKEPEQNS